MEVLGRLRTHFFFNTLVFCCCRWFCFYHFFHYLSCEWPRFISFFFFRVETIFGSLDDHLLGQSNVHHLDWRTNVYANNDSKICFTWNFHQHRGGELESTALSWRLRVTETHPLEVSPWPIFGLNERILLQGFQSTEIFFQRVQTKYLFFKDRIDFLTPGLQHKYSSFDFLPIVFGSLM